LVLFGQGNQPRGEVHRCRVLRNRVGSSVRTESVR
jgi:hypothetical protein